jgi:hypothetical protein
LRRQDGRGLREEENRANPLPNTKTNPAVKSNFKADLPDSIGMSNSFVACDGNRSCRGLPSISSGAIIGFHKVSQTSYLENGDVGNQISVA